MDNIRSDARGSGAFLTKEWDFNPVEDTYDGAQFKDELRRATGVGKARRKKVRGCPERCMSALPNKLGRVSVYNTAIPRSQVPDRRREPGVRRREQHRGNTDHAGGHPD